jgi:hypothetical protein
MYAHVESIITSVEEYRSLLCGGRGYAARGKPAILMLPCSAERIRHHLPGVKLIVILRQPADRALQVYLREPRAAKNLVKQFMRAKITTRVGNRLRRLNLIKPHFW